MSEQKPSIGRIVIFYHPETKDENKKLLQSPGIVQRVNADDTLDIAVLSVKGYADFRKNVERGCKAYHWNWPEKL